MKKSECRSIIHLTNLQGLIVLFLFRSVAYHNAIHPFLITSFGSILYAKIVFV